MNEEIPSTTKRKRWDVQNTEHEYQEKRSNVDVSTTEQVQVNVEVVPDEHTTCTVVPFNIVIQELKEKVQKIEWGASKLNYAHAWKIENNILTEGAEKHVECTTKKTYFVGSLQQLLQIARVGFSEVSPSYTMNVAGTQVVVVDAEVNLTNSYFDIRGRPKDEPVYLLLCNAKAYRDFIPCSPGEINSKQWFNSRSTGVAWRDPVKGPQCAVAHWSQVEPKFIVMLTRKRRNDIWKVITTLPHSLQHCGVTAERPKQGSGLVDSNPQFLCFWDKKPMYRIHVLAMPTRYTPSPEGLPSPALLSQLEQYVQHIVKLFQEVTKIDHFKYGFHADPSQEHLHCHIFTPHELSPIAQNIPPSALRKFSSPYFRTFKELSALISSFTPPLSLQSPVHLVYDSASLRTKVAPPPPPLSSLDGDKIV